MPHLPRRHHSREPKELDRRAGPVSGAQSDDGCRRSQEARRSRLSLDDPRDQALPRGLRLVAENRDLRPGAVRSDDRAIPALGSQSVVVDVRIPAAISYITELRRRTNTKTRSSFPRVEDTDSRALKVGYIPGRDGQTVHQGCGCDEGVTIGARVRYVKHRASLGDGGINRKDTTGECRQHVTIHPRTKDRALLFVAAVDKKDSDLQFQY